MIFYIAGQPTIAVIAINANQNNGSYFLITFGSLSITHILVFVYNKGMCPFGYLMFMFMWVVRNGGKLMPDALKKFNKSKTLQA